MQFTPTLVFFDEKGAVAHRINGYLPPEEFHAALDRIIAAPPAAGSSGKAAQLDVRRRNGAKPIVLVLSGARCDACEELEGHLQTPELRAQLGHFEVLRAANPVLAMTASGGRRIDSAYLPAMVFFADGAEVFRTEAYLRPFHLSSALDYVATRSYAREPSFQRFVQARAEVRRAAASAWSFGTSAAVNASGKAGRRPCRRPRPGRPQGRLAGEQRLELVDVALLVAGHLRGESAHCIRARIDGHVVVEGLRAALERKRHGDRVARVVRHLPRPAERCRSTSRAPSPPAPAARAPRYRVR